jgi:dihydrofolate reductase
MAAAFISAFPGASPSKQKFESTEKSPVVFVASLKEATQLASTLTSTWGDEVFIIGGGEIYKQAFEQITSLMPIYQGHAEMINAKDLICHEGCLNCASWTIYQK